MNKPTHYYHNIPGVEKGFENKCFGNQIESLHSIKKYQESADSIWLSVKRTVFKKVISEFKKLCKPSSYYFKYATPSSDYSDDSIEVWFTRYVKDEKEI